MPVVLAGTPRSPHSWSPIWINPTSLNNEGNKIDRHDVDQGVIHLAQQFAEGNLSLLSLSLILSFSLSFALAFTTLLIYISISLWLRKWRDSTPWNQRQRGHQRDSCFHDPCGIRFKVSFSPTQRLPYTTLHTYTALHHKMAKIFHLPSFFSTLESPSLVGVDRFSNKRPSKYPSSAALEKMGIRFGDRKPTPPVSLQQQTPTNNNSYCYC